MIKEVFFIRHGETDWNITGILQGHQNVDLNDTGLEQIRSVHTVLTDKNIGIIISSPLPRAYKSACIIQKALKATKGKRSPLLKTYSQLVEIALGEWEGRNKTEVDKAYGNGTFAKWVSLAEKDDYADFCQAETKIQLRERALKAMTDIIASHKEHNTLAVVGHGTFLGNFLAYIGRRDIYVKNGDVVRLNYDTESEHWYFKEVIPNPYNQKNNYGLSMSSGLNKEFDKQYKV